MRDVKPLRLEAFVYGVPRIPESLVVCKQLNLFAWNNRVHILGGRGCRGRILKAQPDRAATVDNQTNLVIKSFIECEEQPFRVSGSRAHAATGPSGRIQRVNTPTFPRSMPVISTKRVGCGNLGGSLLFAGAAAHIGADGVGRQVLRRAMQPA